MRLSRAALVAMLVLTGAACNQQTAASADSDATQAAAPAARAGEDTPCAEIETRQPNAPDQKPEFPGQTRACGTRSNVMLDVAVLAKGLVHPWAVEPLPGGDLLVTEKPGRLRIVTAGGDLGQPITGLPPVDARGQGGLLDVALSPDFDRDRTIYWSYAEPRQGGNGTSVARGALSGDRRSLEQVRVIFRAMPTYDGTMHFGSRLAFGPDGMLYITLGERSDAPMRPQAQQMNSHMGKIIRINPDGSVPSDNPFVGQAGALPEIWSLGHRNVQAAAFDAEGRFWAIEHGTQGGDELNLVEKGKNYGWPLVAYGEEYRGTPIAGAVTTKAGFQSPVYYWDPVIAPSGAQFYSGSLFADWAGDLLVGSLKDMKLVRLELEGNRVAREEHLLADRKQRIRDVRQGADGALYIVTDRDDGELWKVTPRR
jgi:glucose/arabinose dehydrogenase